ncbi:acyl-CoA dehydrogenase family protein [Actinomadura sp. HBU206391]|uniref:acyl-CoA dehydrogenase family protein n=1 Tax=Actinomadura sp. HBU206391 TaxID=2731692 RepID=UPI0016501948|nr:acyl-CoA dehydrogenase family protein [Actinomadura sp. HBU206391]MBC6463118.1 acyl-CoA/acyl-ACP dehydrogenase [Actinomadura sp. HBU206391]
MRFSFTADQRLLAGAVREVLAGTSPPDAVRAAAADPSARRGAAWHALARVGLLGALVAEEHGGLGLTPLDTVLAFEETGRFAVPGPLVESAVAAPWLVEPGWLAKIAAGTAAVSVAMPHLLDADVVDLLVMRSGGGVRAVSPDDVTLSPIPSLDATRRLFAASAADAGRAEGDPLGGSPAVFGSAADHAALATAAQLVGLGRRLLEMTVAYAGQRRQFGTAIGSFQAVKHQLADVAIALDFAAPVVYRAAYALTHRTPSAPRDVSAAKIAAGTAAHRAARAALQVHGAIGYTEELDLHLWLTRVWSLRGAWGEESLHRARLRDALLGEPAPPRLPQGVR